MIELLIPEHCRFCKRPGTPCCEKCKEKILCDTPEICIICHKPSTNAATCKSCQKISSIFAVHSIVPYSAPIKRLVHDMKFRPSRQVAKMFANLLAHRCPDDVDVITHVPTAHARIRQRGFDHAFIMARHTARRTGIPYRKLLYRRGSNRQVGASRQQRKRQARAQYYITPKLALPGARVVLIDDVISTGATLEAAASCLRQAGAERVYALVVAHNYRLGGTRSTFTQRER